MSKEKKEKKNTSSKEIFKIIIILGLLVVVFAVILFLAKNFRMSLEDRLNKNLIELGEEFYSDYYYGDISINKTSDEVSKFLSKFETTGISVNLDTLSKYDNERRKSKVSKFEKGNCDTLNTKVIIYPKSPYGKRDYSITAELHCEFDTEEK